MFLVSGNTPVSAESAAVDLRSPVDELVWSRVRESMTDPACAFANRPEYQIMDRDFLDAIIRRLLDKHYNGEMPRTASDRTELMEFARTDCSIALRSQDGLRRLELLFQRRFSNPVTNVSGDSVVVDYGFVPGPLVADSRARITTSKSPHIANDQWSSTEVTGSLARKAHWISAHACIVICVKTACCAEKSALLDASRGP